MAYRFNNADHNKTCLEQKLNYNIIVFFCTRQFYKY